MTLSVYTKGGTVASLRYIYYIYIFLFFYSLVCCLLSVCITLLLTIVADPHIIVQQTE